MSQSANFFAAFPGRPQSPMYGKALYYTPITSACVQWKPGQVVYGLSVNQPLGTDMQFAYIDPNGDIPGQLARAGAAGFKVVELGAPNHMGLGDFMMLLTHVHGLGLGVIAKNAAAYAGSFQYLTHPNVLGCVVERGNGEPRRYDALRRDVGRDGLIPIWFVFDGASNADQCADEIRLFDLKGMGVSYAAGLSGTPYEDSHPVLNPIL